MTDTTTTSRRSKRYFEPVDAASTAARSSLFTLSVYHSSTGPFISLAAFDKERRYLEGTRLTYEQAGDLARLLFELTNPDLASREDLLLAYDRLSSEALSRIDSLEADLRES